MGARVDEGRSHTEAPAAGRMASDGEKNDEAVGRIRALAEHRERRAGCVEALGTVPGAGDGLPSWDDLRDEWYESRLARTDGA